MSPLNSCFLAMLKNTSYYFFVFFVIFMEDINSSISIVFRLMTILSSVRTPSITWLFIYFHSSIITFVSAALIMFLFFLFSFALLITYILTICTSLFLLFMLILLILFSSNESWYSYLCDYSIDSYSILVLNITFVGFG